MKAAIKIPAGWRRLRAGEKVKLRDLYLDGAGKSLNWRLFPAPCYIGGTYSNVVIIRRTRRPKKWGPEGFVESEYRVFMHLPIERGNWMFCRKGSRKLLTYGEWMAAPFDVPQTRFFKRKAST